MDFSSSIFRIIRKLYGIIVSLLILAFSVFLESIFIRSIKSTKEDLETLKRCTSSVMVSAEDVKAERRRTSDDYEDWYIVQYSFEASGKKIVDTYETRSETTKGDRFEVLYNADDPTEHFTETDKNSMPSTKAAAYVFSAVGVFFIVVSLIMIVKTIKE